MAFRTHIMAEETLLQKIISGIEAQLSRFGITIRREDLRVISQLTAYLRSTNTGEGENVIDRERLPGEAGMDEDIESISQMISLLHNAFLSGEAEGAEVTPSIQEPGELESVIRQFQFYINIAQQMRREIPETRVQQLGSLLDTNTERIRQQTIGLNKALEMWKSFIDKANDILTQISAIINRSDVIGNEDRGLLARYDDYNNELQAIKCEYERINAIWEGIRRDPSFIQSNLWMRCILI